MVNNLNLTYDWLWCAFVLSQSGNSKQFYRVPCYCGEDKMIFKTSTFCDPTVVFQASSYVSLLWTDIGHLSLQ